MQTRKRTCNMAIRLAVAATLLVSAGFAIAGPDDGQWHWRDGHEGPLFEGGKGGWPDNAYSHSRSLPAPAALIFGGLAISGAVVAARRRRKSKGAADPTPASERARQGE